MVHGSHIALCVLYGSQEKTATIASKNIIRLVLYNRGGGSESLYKTDTYRGADKALARPTSRCILFDGGNISFDASLVIYINSTNIPPIMIINRTSGVLISP